jgi:predicted Rdx family selenoprotein
LGYDNRAASLAAELNANGFEAVDTPGEKSQFDVVADGRLVFSKQQAGRFPEPGEIRATLS